MGENQLSDEELDDVVDCAYKAGERRIWKDLLLQAVHGLGVDDPHAAKVLWILERAEAIAALREVCKAYGYNSWPDDLRLADIITKHLCRILESTR